jgi:3-oxoacyl-[acyl-carrier protein] reductase
MRPARHPRTAVVTGAARGIGAAIALRLAQDGHAVAVLDLDEADCNATVSAIRAAGGRALAVAADVADQQAVDMAVARVVAELGAPTILVNNAGVTRDALAHKMTEDDWDLVLRVNLRGSFMMTRACARHMIAAGFGRVVVLSSTSAQGIRGQLNYAAAKAGLQGFAKALAVELGPHGVTANAVAPGFIETELTAAVAKRLGMSYADYLASRVALFPAGRPGQVADVAGPVAFLCGDEAGFVNGQVLYVAGGPRD